MLRGRSTSTKARKAVKLIRHAMYDIVDLIPGENAQFTALYPVIVENGYDLLAQVDQAVEWIYQLIPWEDSDEFVMRTCFHRFMVDKMKNQHAAPVPKPLRHTSKSSQEDIEGRVGDKNCFTRLYKHDYAMLQTIRELSCKTSKRKDALESILRRRGIQVR